jgi:hypothetical protein
MIVLILDADALYFRKSQDSGCRTIVGIPASPANSSGLRMGIGNRLSVFRRAHFVALGWGGGWNSSS